MIIDFHTHAWPDGVAPRAIEVLQKSCNGMPNFTKGTLGDTKEKMKSWGINKFVVLNISTNEKQQKKVNDFAIAGNGGDCIMFGSVYPFSENALSELERIKAAGLKGIKLHSEYQNFYADDKRMYPVYEKIRELGLLLVFHGGTDVAYTETPVRCQPKAVKKISEDFPGLTIIMAHLGGYREYDQTIKYLAGTDVYLDTSAAMEYFEREQAERIINLHGEGRLLFGSDCPWGSAASCAKYIDSLRIPASKKEAIYYKNAKDLLKL